jgi:DnaJ homolog subfamily C member 17
MSAEDSNPYELLGVKIDATEQEIKTAYRQRSLKIHPDKVYARPSCSSAHSSHPQTSQNPNNPNAPRLFHELNQAYELLLDPLRKLALDAKLRLKQARAERYAAYDSKRKNLVAELEEREEAFKRSKLDKQEREATRHREEERIKEEGRKMREERERQLRQRAEDWARVQEDEAMPPEIGIFISSSFLLSLKLIFQVLLTQPSV